MTICDGRDDILGRKPDSKNTVTIVTTDTEEVANILFPTSSPAGRKGAFDSIAVIADLTGNRGGVYYEAGIARGLQLCNHPLKLILTCQKDFFDKESVHFDLRGNNIVLYQDIKDLKEKLSDKLKNILTKQ